MSLEGPVFRDIGGDDDDGDEVEGKVLVAVIGAGPQIHEIVTYGQDEGDSITYRTTRPITVAMAYNQALMYGADHWYDAVVLLRGALPSWPLARQLWAAATADPSIALVTGLDSPSAGGARGWVAAQLAEEFGTEVIDIPAPSPDCMLIVLSALRRIDRLDQNFKQGSEIDWAMRARKAGMRVVAAPAVPLGGPMTAPPEGMVLFRHPSLIKDQKAFWASGAVEAVQARAARALVRAAARSIGYTVDVTTQPRPIITHDSLARVSIRPEPASTVDIRFAGLQAEVEVGEGEPADVLELAFGRPAERVAIYDQGEVAERLSVWEFMGVPIDDKTSGGPSPAGEQ